jgi:hypothetical protein
MKPYTRDSSNNRLRQTLGPWTDQRIWPVYYDSSSQMLCQMVQTPQHETATPGTANCLGRVPGRATIHRYRDAAWKIPPDAVPVTVLLETPTLLRCSIPSYRRRLGGRDTRSESCNVPRHTWQLYRCGNRTSLLMQRRSNADSSLYELLQQRNVNILAASDGGQRMTTAPSVG